MRPRANAELSEVDYLKVDLSKMGLSMPCQGMRMVYPVGPSNNNTQVTSPLVTP